MGKGDLPPPSPPRKCCKVLYVLQMISRVSVDEVFMHHFEKMLSASEGFAPRPAPGLCPWTAWGTSVLQTPLLSTPGKILWALTLSVNKRWLERKR